MKKVIIQGIITVALFFASWFILAQINWVGILRVEKLTTKTEEKLGDLFWKTIRATDQEITHPSVTSVVDSIVSKIGEANHIDQDFIKVHVVDQKAVNAFALPNGHLVIYSGLIVNSDNAEELAGVIGHEIAHIELNHVMKKLVKEVGLSALISMASGSGSSDVLTQAAKVLSSTAFDRNLEKEADLHSVDYLVNARINPEPFADFLYKLSTDEREGIKYLSWISTHPETKERAEYILEYCRDKKEDWQPAVSESVWNQLQVELTTCLP